MGEQTFYVCSHVIECKENATLLSTSTISSLEKYPEILRSFLFLQIIENKCLQLIPHGFLFSSREKLDFTVEGIELHPEKKRKLSYLAEICTQHRALFALSALRNHPSPSAQPCKHDLTQHKRLCSQRKGSLSREKALQHRHILFLDL